MKKEEKLRSWVGDNAIRNDLDVARDWVVWGVGAAPPEEMPDAGGANDVAQMVARGNDPEWFETDEAYRWVITIRAYESDIDAVARDHPDSVWGYAPYLAEGKPEEMPATYMRGTLRNDVAPRRKVDQPRPVD